MIPATEFRAYFDTGALIKLYHLEPGSDEAIAWASREHRLPLPFLCEIELRTALRALHGRGLLPKQQLDSALRAFAEDIAADRLVRVTAEEQRLQTIAEDLSQKHVAETLARTLDLLHVATARALGIRRFVTGDKRQADLATRAGLEVHFITA